MSRAEERRRAAYVAAVNRLTPLVRSVFLLNRAGGRSYDEIGKRLSIDQEVVILCIARALLNVSHMLDGLEPRKSDPPEVTEAQIELFREYMASHAHRSMLTETANSDDKEPKSFRVVHRLPVLTRWLCIPARLKGHRQCVPPAKTFDEWLRDRDGPEIIGQVARISYSVPPIGTPSPPITCFPTPQCEA